MPAKRGNTAGSPPSDAGRRIGGQRHQPVMGQFEFPIMVGERAENAVTTLIYPNLANTEYSRSCAAKAAYDLAPVHSR